MNISVIIPTYNRLKPLLNALHSLQEQRLSEFEILVVDNAADSEVAGMVAVFNQTAIVSAYYIAEPCLGLHNARHAGARAANGELLVFTDDDATFDPGWLAAYQRAFAEHLEMAAAGGPIRPVWEVPPPRWLLDFLVDNDRRSMLSIMEPYHEFRIDPHGYFYGANMAIRREALESSGGFNPETFGDRWLGDGESGLNRKLRAKGLLVGYVPGALAYHHLPSSRMTIEYLYGRGAKQGACTEYARFQGRIPGTGGLILRMTRIGLAIIRLGLITLIRIMRLDRFAFLQARIDLGYHLARLHYVFRLFSDQDLRESVMKTNWL